MTTHGGCLRVRFRPSGLLKGESFIAEEDEDELSPSDDD